MTAYAISSSRMMTRLRRSGGTALSAAKKKGMLPNGSKTRKNSTAADAMVTSNRFLRMAASGSQRKGSDLKSRRLGGRDGEGCGVRETETLLGFVGGAQALEGG